jgi:peptide/nickel transport system substrate-binding protein
MLALIGAASLVFSGLAACTSNNTAATSAAAGAGGTAVTGGTLHFGVLDAPQYLDPHEASSYPESIVADNITDKLTWQDPTTGKLYPWLATSWSYNKQLTQFTFHLRKGVTFSDGTAFNSSSVKANFDQDARGDSALGIPADPTHWTGYVGTDTPDPYTAVVKFSQPNAGFLTFTSFSGDNDPGFVAQSTLEKSKTQRAENVANIIGTGPFVLKSFKYQQNVVLVRRKGYDWAPQPLQHSGNGGAAYLNEIDIETIPEATVRTGSLESGALDATLDVQPTDEAPLKAEGFQILAQTVAGQNISFSLNTSLFPTNDLAVRQAIQIGWDRNALTKGVLTSSYKVATSVIASKVPGYVDYANTALKYDPAQAKKLLDDDGWKVGANGIRVKDGKQLVVKFLGINNLVANEPAYELIQSQLKQIGISVQLSVLPIPDFEAQEAKAQTNWNGVAGNTSRDDPSVLWQADSPLVGNGSYVESGAPERQALINDTQAIQNTLDPTQRDAATKATQDLIFQYALVAPVYEPAQVIAANKKVHGIVFDAQSRNLFYNTYLSK